MKDSITNEQLEKFGEMAVSNNVEKELREKYQLILQDKYNLSRNQSNKKRIKWYSILIIIALILLAAYKIGTLSKKPVTHYAYKYLESTYIASNPDIARKGTTSVDSLKIHFNDLFIKKKYNEAEVTLKEILTLNKGDSTSIFYLGVCQLYQQNIPEAIGNFKRLDGNSPYYQESQWLLGLACILDYQNDKSLKYLQSLKEIGNYKEKETKELIKRLK